LGVELATHLFGNMETRLEIKPLFDVQVELNSFKSESRQAVLSVSNFVPHEELYIEVTDLCGSHVEVQ